MKYNYINPYQCLDCPYINEKMILKEEIKELEEKIQKAINILEKGISHIDLDLTYEQLAQSAPPDYVLEALSVLKGEK